MASHVYAGMMKVSMEGSACSSAGRRKAPVAALVAAVAVVLAAMPPLAAAQQDATFAGAALVTFTSPNMDMFGYIYAPEANALQVELGCRVCGRGGAQFGVCKICRVCPRNLNGTAAWPVLHNFLAVPTVP